MTKLVWFQSIFMFANLQYSARSMRYTSSNHRSKITIYSDFAPLILYQRIMNANMFFLSPSLSFTCCHFELTMSWWKINIIFCLMKLIKFTNLNTKWRFTISLLIELFTHFNWFQTNNLDNCVSIESHEKTQHPQIDRSQEKEDFHFHD